ncbi:hypothetical protein D5R38_18685 [Serratia marcescens]|uniref:hypothetical protein n=1 Tax=Serratia marcescens TaxID=615 RepID=UPI0010674289|nr:hypothetical protein [Serratia marcescens]TEW83398.1 hypothetical protein D5R38_18685 [Serratia marcescens]
MKFIIISIATVMLAACAYSGQNQKLTGANRVIYCANQDYNPATAPNDIAMCRLGLTQTKLGD